MPRMFVRLAEMEQIHGHPGTSPTLRNALHPKRDEGLTRPNIHHLQANGLHLHLSALPIRERIPIYERRGHGAFHARHRHSQIGEGKAKLTVFALKGAILRAHDHAINDHRHRLTILSCPSWAHGEPLTNERLPLWLTTGRPGTSSRGQHTGTLSSCP